VSYPIAAAHDKQPRRNRRELTIFGALALLIIGLDQLTKYWAQQYLLPLGGFLKFTYTENTGAAFSIGTGITWLFTLIAVGVVVVIFRYARRLGSLWWALALGGLLGGSLGNLIDRMFRSPGPFEGSVVDFIQLPYWAIFNIADMAVVISGIGLAILLVRGVPLDGKPEMADSQVESDL
jgi:signal peptidase II